MYFAFLNFVLYPVGCIYLPYILNVILKAEPFQAALVQASFFIGVFIGSFIVPLFSQKGNFRSTLINASIIVFLVNMSLAIPVSPIIKHYFNVWAIVVFYIAVTLVMGISMTFVNIHIGVIFQRKVKDEVRGRVSSLISAMMPIGFFTGGYLAQSVRMYILIVISSLVFGASIVVISKFKQLKEL